MSSLVSLGSAYARGAMKAPRAEVSRDQPPPILTLRKPLAFMATCDLLHHSHGDSAAQQSSRTKAIKAGRELRRLHGGSLRSVGEAVGPDA